MAANPISCPINVDIDDYLVAAEVVTSTPRIRLARVADMVPTLARRSNSTASRSRFNCSAACCNVADHLLLGIGTRVVDDLAAFRPGVVAEATTPGLELPSWHSRSRLGRLRTARSPSCCRRRSWRPSRRVRATTFMIGGTTKVPMTAEHDKEDRQHEEEGAVGNKEVVASLCCLAGCQNTRLASPITAN